jgi:hypothetical protein
MDQTSPDELATELERQRHELADLQVRVRALSEKRKHREAMAQQVSDGAASDSQKKADK